MPPNKHALHRFGQRLAALRDESELTQAALASGLGMTASQLSKIETGKRVPSQSAVHALDDALGADGHLRNLWNELTGSGRPAWLEDLTELEQRAVSIIQTHTALFPTLLQTEPYASAVARATSPWASTEEIDAAVKARMLRAERFAESSSPVYRLVIPTTVITNSTEEHGYTRQVLQEQLAHVVKLIERGRISVQLVETWCHPGLVGPFMVIATPAAPDVVYVESADAGRTVDDPDRVHRFRLVLGDLQAVALSPERSVGWLREQLEGLR